MTLAMGWKKPSNIAGSSAPAIMVGLFVASGGLIFGYDTGTINGVLAMMEFRRQFSTGYIDPADGQPQLTTPQSSMVVAILSIGTFLGSLLAAPAADALGRRLSLLFSVLVFCIGGICQVVAQALPMLLAGRFIAGVGIGGISVFVPLYEAEMAPKWIRGTLVCAYQLSITLGLLWASVVGMSTSGLSSAAAYRIPLGLQLAWAFVLAAGLLVLPETPRYLVRRGLPEKAAISLSRLRRLDITHPALIDELHEIVANHEYELQLGPDTYRALFFGRPSLGLRTLTGCGLQILQQLTGINFIMYYSTSFFSGVGVEDPYTKSLIINVINFVSTIPGLLVIESWGRRKLLLVGAVGMAVCQLFIASFSAAAGPGHNLHSASETILIAFCAVNIFFFAASWGPVVWVITSELFPLKVRAKGMSVATASNWLLNFAIAYSTPWMVSDRPGSAGIGPKVFFIWGGFCIVAIFFVWGLVYETSKISLEQIDEMYERVDRAWRSTNFAPSWSFQQLVDDGWSPSGNPPVEGEHELQPSGTTQSVGAASNGTSESAASTAVSLEGSSAEAKMVAQLGRLDFSI